MRRRGRLKNVSFFAFTATPKAKTLELFNTPDPRTGQPPFSLYSMRQAIEEGFILDVLQNYTTFKVYFSLLKKIETDPQYDRKKGTYLLRSYADLHPHAIHTKSEMILDHFEGEVKSRIACMRCATGWSWIGKSRSGSCLTRHWWPFRVR